MDDESDGYQAYLLRLWRVRCQGRWEWRSSIESPHTDEQHSFGTLAGLFAFLNDKTRQKSAQSRVDTQDEDPSSLADQEEEKLDAQV